MPSRAYTSLLLETEMAGEICYQASVSMPSRAYTSLLLEFVGTDHGDIHVSMPSRAYTSLLQKCKGF